MTNEEKINVVINIYGSESQQIQAIEEFSELSQALAKNLKGKGDIDNIKEEIADAAIMLEQLQIIFKIKDEEIYKIIDKKLDRTLDRAVRDKGLFTCMLAKYMATGR